MKLFYTFIAILFIQIIFSQNSEFAKNRILFSFNDSKQISAIDDIGAIEALQFLYNDFSIKRIKLLDKAYSKSNKINNRPILIEFNNTIEVEAVIDALKNTNLFLYVEPDFINYGSGIKKEDKLTPTKNTENILFTTTPNDTYFFRQWALHNDGTFNLSPSTVDADIDMIEAWDHTTGNPNITMAVMDSGLRMTHPEFTGRIWTNPNETTNGTDTDSNGYIDDINGWDFVNDDNNPTDDHGHGTNVAGIATATGNNGIGYAGVDWSCKVMPLKVLDNNNSGFTSNIIESFYYAIANNVKIISISIGGSGFSVAYETAINSAYNNGIIVVACMMNFNNNVSYYPAAFTNTIAVGSTDSNDERTEPFFWSNTSGSNYGNHIDVVAPGNYMYGLSYSSDNNYNSYWGGTSQATPLVSGICSLMLSLNPNLTVDEIRAILRDTAEDLVGDAQDTVGWDQYYGAGRVNAFNALSRVLSTEDYSYTNLTIYPNPVVDNLHISTYKLSSIKNYTITNISGQLLKTGIIEDNSIDCSFLSEGVYFVKLTSDSGISELRKFIKK
ncbi:S8 family serine peptidase [Winogradskyella pulchriflava]|uniref:S8 family serine peptidase n=1 Tax=Winogradskyella pulchriflava TaxID=1110688 RepID=A0ABV6Q4P5_9FLAO